MSISGSDRALRYAGMVTDEERIAARFFYLECRRFVGWLAGISNLTIEQVAAITAALSPRAVWRQNQLDAIAICQGGEIPSRKQGFQALPRDLNRAIAIRDGGDITQILSGVKVNAFYRNMLYPESDDIGIPIDRHICRAIYGHQLTDADITLKLRGDGYARAQGIVEECAARLSLRPIELANRLWYVMRRLSASQGQHSLPLARLDWRPLYPGGDYHLSMRKRDKPALNLLPGCEYRPWLEETPFTAPAFGNEFMDRGRVCVNIGRGHRYAKPGQSWEYRYRLVVKYELDRMLSRDEHVHHLTGRCCDDNPSQLELLLVAVHGKYHSTLATLAGYRNELGRFVEQGITNTLPPSYEEVPF